MHQMMIEISNDTYQEASSIAAQTGKSVETILALWLNHTPDEIPIELLKNEQVLKIADMMMPEDEQAELNDLLEKNREGKLDAASKQGLDKVMKVYKHNQKRKAEAMAEAVKRGLRSKNLDEWPE